MADATPARWGQVNGSGDTTALFLKVFGGEVLTSYENTTMMKDRTQLIDSKGGKSVQIPIVDNIVSGYHTAGAEILGNSANINERVIILDNTLYTSSFIDDWDTMISQYDYSGVISNKMGYSLANMYDKNIFSLAIKTAHDTGAGGTGLGSVPGQGNAQVQTLANASFTISDIRAAVKSAATAFDKKNVPKEDRYLAVTPDVYYMLLDDDKNLNSLYSVPATGSWSAAKLPPVLGFEIFPTNNLQVDFTGVSGMLSKYTYNASKVQALAFHKDAIWTAQAMGIKTKVTDDPRRLGKLMVASTIVGHQVVRPESLYSIESP